MDNVRLTFFFSSFWGAFELLHLYIYIYIYIYIINFFRLRAFNFSYIKYASPLPHALKRAPPCPWSNHFLKKTLVTRYTTNFYSYPNMQYNQNNSFQVLQKKQRKNKRLPLLKMTSFFSPSSSSSSSFLFIYLFFC